MLWLTSLHLTSFAALGIAALAPLLIAAYIYKTQSNQVTVPSVLIFKKLATLRHVRRRVRLPVRFFIELLALLLLVLSVARPYFSDQGKRIGILIDNSLSMQASSSEGRVRIDDAKLKAKEWVKSHGSTQRYDVYSMSPSIVKIIDGAFSSGAISAIDSLSSSLSVDAMSSAISELAKSGNYKQIVIFTDKVLEARSQNKDDATASENGFEPEMTSLEVVRVGMPQPNIYLSNVYLSKPPMAHSAVVNETLLTANILGSLAQSLSIEVRLYALMENSSERTLSLISSKQIDVGANGVAKVEFVILPQHKATAYQLRLIIPALSNGNVINAILEDDIAWITDAKVGGKSVLLVTPELSEEPTRGLSKISGLATKAISADLFGGLTATDLSQYSLLIFHKTSPINPPRVPTLLILPPKDNAIFPVMNEVSRPLVTSWLSNHAITAYLRVPLLEPRQSILFSTPLWAQSVINAEDGALLCAGESQGVRFVAVGMELLPFEGISTPVPTVLFLNIINWLTGGGNTGVNSAGVGNIVPTLGTGYSFPLAPEFSWTVEDPQNNVRKIGVSKTNAANTNDVRIQTGKDRSVEESDLYQFPLTLQGLYSFQSVSSSGETVKQIIAVNSLFPEESRTFENSTLSLQDTYLRVSELTEDSLPIWPWILGVVVIVMIMDFLLRIVFASRT